MAVSTKEVKKIADLSNLRFAPEELERLVHHFQEILDYVAQLESVATQEVEPTYHAVEQGRRTTPMREDAIKASFPAAKALANAPDPAEDHFRVPAVIE